MGNHIQEPLLQEMERLRQRNLGLERTVADYRTILSNSPQSFILIGRDYKIHFFNNLANETAKTVVGIEIVVGQSILELVPEKNLESFNNNFNQALAGKTFTGEKYFRDTDGNEYWFLVSFYPVFSEAGKVTEISFSGFNITERKVVEQNLQESEQKFTSLFEISPDAILLADASTGLIIDANAAAGKLFEKPVQEIRGMYQKEFHPPDEWEKARTTFAHRPPTPELAAPPVEIDIITGQNHRKSVEIHGQSFQINGKEFVLGNFRDVTERKVAEEALKESQANLLAILESTDDLICSRDRDGKLVYFNQACAKIIKRLFNVEAFIGLNTMEHLPENDRKNWKEILAGVLSGKRYRGEFMWDFSAGDVRYYEITFIPIRKDHEIIGTVELNRDITSYRLSEQALRASETRFRQILENSFSGAYSRNLVTDTYDYISPAFEKLTGYTQEELTSMPTKEYLAHLHPDDVETAISIVEESKKADKNPYYVEYRFRHRNGEYRWLADLFNVIIDGHRVPLFRYGNVRDITESKRTDEVLKNREKQLAQIINVSPNLIAVKDANGKFILANTAIAALLQSSPEELIGKCELELVDKNLQFHEIQTFLKDNLEVIATGQPKINQSQRFTLPDGTVKYFKSQKVPFELTNQEKAVLVVATEITELVEYENRLKESEFLLKEAQKIAHVGHWIWDLQKQEVIWSDEIFNIFGYTRENFEVSTENFEKTIHPDDLDEFIRQREAALSSDSTLSIVHRIVRSDGEIRYVNETARIIRDAAQKPVKAFGTVQDVTEQKVAELALQTSEERFTLAVQGTRDGLCDWNLITNHFYHSEQFSRILEYGPDEIPETFDAFLALIHPDDRDAVQSALQAYLTNGDQIFEATFRMQTKTEIFNWMTCRGSSVRDADGKPYRFIGFISDITERKNLEEQLQQSQKMEAIGKLAGGIAHDFNNLLTVINGYSDILLADLAGNLPEYEDLQQIKRAGIRAASLTNQLLAFSRKQVLKLEILNVNDLLNNLEQMLERLIGEDIELITCREKDLAEIKADRGQIEQIIVNLAVNARDAMPRGGELLIRTQNTLLDEEFIRQNCRIKPGPYVLISISDTGMGMNRQILEHIFEPFFTTKDVGKGTGLGLSTVYGIVKQSGGDVCVQSEPGIGTIFDIYLPAIARPVIADRQSPECARSFVGTETILLVEDEKSVLGLVQKTLERLGYHLITATDGVEALNAIQKYKKTIHLLLSDVVMPNMSGKELAEKIGPFHPETKVCFMSGYTDDAIIRHGVLDAKVHFIQKPFSPESLAKRVREILDTR